jgi:hypothetical protein
MDSEQWNRWTAKATSMGYFEPEVHVIAKALQESYELGRSDTVQGDLFKFNYLLGNIRHGIVLLLVVNIFTILGVGMLLSK